jgi:hypothetical protein
MQIHGRGREGGGEGREGRGVGGGTLRGNCEYICTVQILLVINSAIPSEFKKNMP